MKKILGCFLVLGFLFRLLYLGTRQLWTEEIMQALVVRRAPAELFQALLTGMTLPAPLDYFIQYGPVWLFGESPWALRIHAAVLGTVSVWLVVRIARRMFGDRVAIFAGVLFILYPLAYHYSQEARPHALLLLLTLASYDQLLRIVGGDECPMDVVVVAGRSASSSSVQQSGGRGSDLCPSGGDAAFHVQEQ